MNVKGRSIRATPDTPGAVTRYLLHNTKNEKAIYLGAQGTAFPDDLERSVAQMMLAGEDSKSEKPLYFGILSPDLTVDKTLTADEWEQMRLIQARHLGLENQPFTWVEHHKRARTGDMRVHRHVIYQRFDPDTGKMIGDEFDRRRNADARAEIEITLGHQRTFQRWTLEEIKERELKQQRQIEQQKALEKQQQERAALEFLLNSKDVTTSESYERLKQKYAQEKDRGISY
ncbi:hypothetical protein GCM10027347_59230 [Larkinella harenae]